MYFVAYLLFFFLFTGVYKPVECWQIDENHASRPMKRRHGSSVFTLKEMEEATGCFSDENLLGKGGFGRVYKGTLRSGEVYFYDLGFSGKFRHIDSTNLKIFHLIRLNLIKLTPTHLRNQICFFFFFVLFIGCCHKKNGASSIQRSRRRT